MKATLLKTLGSLAAVTLLLGANVSAAQNDASQNKAEKVAAQQVTGAASNLVSDFRNALGIEGSRPVAGPEPTRSLLMMVGAAAMLLRRRR